MPDLPFSIPAVIAWLIGLGVIATGLGVFWARVGKPAWAVITFIQRLLPIVEKFPGIEADIAKVKAEVTTNGGSSIKDAVQRIEKQNTAQTAHLETLSRKVDAAAEAAATASELARAAIAKRPTPKRK